MQFILQIFPWYSAICMFFKTKYFSFQPKTFKARLLSIVVNISGKKLFFITNFQGCKVMRRRCSDSLLSASLLPVGRAARKNCESVLRDNFFLISCHILLLRTKLLILQTPMGKLPSFCQPTSKTQKRKVIFEAKFERNFLLSFLHFLSDSQLFLRRQKLNNGCEISFKNYFSFLKADREYFFLKTLFTSAKHRGWS